MKVTDIFENEQHGDAPVSQTKPSVTYRQNGDKSWNVRIVTASGGVAVHTRKKRSDLEKIVKARYK